MTITNTVIFVADQMRSDSLHHLGNAASITPNLDNLVSHDAVSFRNAYCQNPVCVPSRCSFLTGWYPHTKGHRTMHYLLEPNDPNMFKSMKNNGINVYWIGRNHIIPVDQTTRIQDCCEVYYGGLKSTDAMIHRTTGKTIENIRKDIDYYSFVRSKLSHLVAKSDQDSTLINYSLDLINKKKLKEPFCLYISINYPHPPYECDDPWYNLIDRSKVEKPRDRITNESSKPSMLKGIVLRNNLKNYPVEKFIEMKAIYLGMVARVDHQFGQIVKALKNNNLYECTNIVFFADHGDYTGDYGIAEKSQNTFENPITNVPLIIKPAKGFSVKPRISNALVELIDIGSTLSDLCDFIIEYTQFGKSLRNVLSGDEIHRDAVFCEGGRIHGETQAMEGLTTNEDSIYWPRLKTQCEEGPEHTKAIMIRSGDYKYVYRLYESDEFYDLKKDPLECENKISDDEYIEIISNLRIRVLKFMVETADFVPNRKDKTR